MNDSTLVSIDSLRYYIDYFHNLQGNTYFPIFITAVITFIFSLFIWYIATRKQSFDSFNYQFKLTHIFINKSKKDFDSYIVSMWEPDDKCIKDWSDEDKANNYMEKFLDDHNKHYSIPKMTTMSDFDITKLLLPVGAISEFFTLYEHISSMSENIRNFNSVLKREGYYRFIQSDVIDFVRSNYIDFFIFMTWRDEIDKWIKLVEEYKPSKFLLKKNREIEKLFVIPEIDIRKIEEEVHDLIFPLDKESDAN